MLRSGFGELLKPAAFWLGPREPMDAEEATLEVARRYLTRYGPANREALARWFGMPSPAEAGRWLKRLGDEAVEAGGEYMLAADVEAAGTAEPDGAVRLLPAFDHYVVAAPRGDDDVVAAAHRERVYRPQAWLSPGLVLDGRILGVWSYERKDGLEVEIEPFGRLPKGVRAGAEAEAAALAAFLGDDDVTVRWS
jgi:hypothetical protein